MAAEWEQQCLVALRDNGLPVVSVEIRGDSLKGGYICATHRLVVKYAADADELLPPSMVLKIEEPDSNDHAIAAELQLYEREWHFFEVLQERCAEVIRCPRYYGTVKDGGLKVGVIMEDLELLGHCSSKITRSLLCPNMDRDAIMLTVDHLARLHALFFSKEAELERLGVKPLNCGLLAPSRVASQWPGFLAKWQDEYSVLDAVSDEVIGEAGSWSGFGLSADALRAADKIVQGFSWVQNELSTAPCTFLHGDVKPPNMFFLEQDGIDGFTPTFIDWQYTAIGKGVCDVVFFMVEGFTIAEQRQLEPLLMARYHTALVANGIHSYSEQELQRDWKLATMHFPIYVCMWFGSATDGNLVDPTFPKRFVPRAMDAILRNGAHHLIPAQTVG